MFNINSTLSRRNFLAGAAALGSTAALAGCSSGGSDGGSADDGKTFKIGVIGPLTGAAATYGVSAEKGAKLAAKDFSTKDLKLSLKSEDDVADGEKAINAFNTLCDWGMQALVGPVTTGAAVAVSGEIADDMLMVTPSASSLDVTKDKTTVFQVCFTDPTMGASAAKFLAEKYADAKIALFYNSGDTYSSGVADAFAEQAKHPSSTSSIPRPLRTTLPRALPTSSPRPRRPAPRLSLRRSTTRRRPSCSRTPRTWATT